MSARGTHHGSTPISTDSPTPTPSRPASQDADPGPTPSVYLASVPDFTDDAEPHDVHITFTVQNLTGLDLAIVGTHFVLANAGQARVISAGVRYQRSVQVVPPGTSVIAARATATMLLEIDLDCAQQDVTGYVVLDFFGVARTVVHQRIELPTGLSLPALIASSCKSVTANG
jgi:hypothetical protein